MIKCPAHIRPAATKICGNKVAVVTGDAQVTFDELEQRVGLYHRQCSHAPLSL